jgi:hypothetical protein
MAGTVCNFATQLKFIFKFDDTLDVGEAMGMKLSMLILN